MNSNPLADIIIIEQMEQSARLSIKLERLSRLAFDVETDEIRDKRQALKNARSNVYKARKVYRDAGLLETPKAQDHIAELQGKVSKLYTAYKTAIRNSEHSPIFAELKRVQAAQRKAKKAVKSARASQVLGAIDYSVALTQSRRASDRSL